MMEAKLLDKLVADAIPAYPDAPRTAADIAGQLTVPRERVLRSIARLKEDFPALPLVSGSDGYRWSRDPVDAKRHVRKEVRYVSTRTRRSLLDGLLEPYLKDCDEESLDRARGRIESILDDLARLAVDASGYRRAAQQRPPAA